MIDHADILYEAHRCLLTARKIEFTVKSDLFIRALKSSSEDERADVHKFITAGDFKAIKTWMECNPTDRLEDRSHNSLKQLGKQYGITNWSRLTKLELVEEIKRKESK